MAYLELYIHMNWHGNSYSLAHVTDIHVLYKSHGR
jgi:hypothetical protein